MALPAFRAKQSTSTVGTGTLALDPAAAAFRSYQAAFGGSSIRVPYVISWATGYELGFGDFDGLSPGSLTRATVLASSNAGALVNLPAGVKDVFAFLDPGGAPIVSISAGYTALLSDLGNTILFTGGTIATLTLPAAASVPPGGGYVVQNAGSATLTIDPAGAETIDGVTTFAVAAGTSAQIARSGAGWVKVGTLNGASALGRSLGVAADAAAARSTIVAPALPVNTGGTAGQWVAISSAEWAALVLPSGGTWAFYAQAYSVINGLWQGNATGVGAGGGNAAGGLQSCVWSGMAWRIV